MTKDILTVGWSPGNNNDDKEQSEIKNIVPYNYGSHNWDDVIKEVMRRKANGKKADLLSEKEEKAATKSKTNSQESVLLNKKASIVSSEAKNKISEGRPLARYELGAKYNGIYFTRREAECMVELLKGKTLSSVATILGISKRTIEFYLKNMKIKVGCRTKFELIDFVNASEFLKNIDL